MLDWLRDAGGRSCLTSVNRMHDPLSVVMQAVMVVRGMGTRHLALHVLKRVRDETG